MFCQLYSGTTRQCQYNGVLMSLCFWYHLYLKRLNYVIFILTNLLLVQAFPFLSYTLANNRVYQFGSLKCSLLDNVISALL